MEKQQDKSQDKDKTRTASPTPTPEPGSKVQGEGDYDAARRYRKEVGDFVSTHDVNKVAHEAAPKSATEARELALAEDKGRSRSKGDNSGDAAEMSRQPPPKSKKP